MNILLPIREFIINNFFISIKSLQINKTIIKNNIFFHLFKFIPFFFLKILFNFFNIKYIYLMDSLYFSNYSNEVKVSPVLMSFHTYQSTNEENKILEKDKLLEKDKILEEDKINLMDLYKKYNSNIPLWFFFENEKIININILYIKYFSKGVMNVKEITFKDNEKLLLTDIF